MHCQYRVAGGSEQSGIGGDPTVGWQIGQHSPSGVTSALSIQSGWGHRTSRQSGIGG